ncbi:MAG TPA: S9 family peptidase [Candidatus Acidoferrum sp.]|jgi:dipeptidyl aminopeptidase/acylaminoacyl peptidase
MRSKFRFPARLAMFFAAAGILCSGFLVMARAQESAAAGTKKLTPEEALTLRAISELHFSPDGMRLAFVLTEAPRGTTRARHIWLYEQSSGAVRQITFSAKTESSPRWSPDGKQLAFLSNRGEQQQIYLMQMGGGEAAAITKGKRSVGRFEWSPDGKEIAFVAPDAKSEEEEKKEKDKDDARVVDKDTKHGRIWLLNVASGETRAITKANWEVGEITWMPDGKILIVKATDHPEADQNTERIFAVQVSDGAMKELIAPRGPFGELQISKSGNTISYVGSREDGPEPHDLMLLTAGTDILAQNAGRNRAARNLTGASLDRPVEDYHWRKDGSVLLLAANGFKNELIEFSEDGAKKDVSTAPASPGTFAVSDAGEIAFVSQSAAQAPELWLRDAQGVAKQISHFNDAWKEFALSTPEYYKYKSFDGMEIEAALLKPAGADGKTKLPLVVLVHGGPTGRWADSIETWGQLLAAHGYAVFYPNIRGSVGYGQKFVEANRADWGGADFKDVMAGVRDLVDHGIADPKRMGIGGWSYGGYMAEWAITQTNDFKAAVTGAGMANLMSEFGTETGSSYDEWFWGLPWEKPAGFLNSSPVIHLKEAKTPTLVLQGDADTTDPLGQSEELYRGLKRYGVEAELVVYPREPHGFREEKHLVDRLNRILAWYDGHLK